MHKESISRLCGYKLRSPGPRTSSSSSPGGTVTSSAVSRLDDGVEVAGLPCPTPCSGSSRRRLLTLLRCKSQTILPSDSLSAFFFSFLGGGGGSVSSESLSSVLITGHGGAGEGEVW
ncbi:hypothetical protein OIU79_006161 [Salix purpurea]|uniref:Uncharacterized protein n=1 Tax=Salix purpurea TaxID=77065 RepID=A0A9Q0Z1T2_SALPP|nr:hypothetical protein OIU79_006161 [Salix purpurea]